MEYVPDLLSINQALINELYILSTHTYNEIYTALKDTIAKEGNVGGYHEEAQLKRMGREVYCRTG